MSGDATSPRLTPKQLIEAVRGVLSAVKNGSGPVAVVVNNNQPETQHIIETAPGVTLDVGTALYAVPSEKRGKFTVNNLSNVQISVDISDPDADGVSTITVRSSAPSAIAPRFSEKPTAWLIVRHSGTGGQAARHLEVVLSPLTDDTFMDEGDEAWPLHTRLSK